MAQQAAPRTVLLVEDEPSIRHLLYRHLEDRGYELLEASSGSKALEIARQYHEGVDLLLTDVVMPKMNGFTLAAELAFRHPEMRVLFITGYAAARSEVEENLRWTRHRFLLKPFTATALTQRVEHLLRRREGAQPSQQATAQRFFKRIPVLYQLSDQTASLRGHTIDMSDSGILLDALSPLTVGSRLDLTFESSEAFDSLGSGTINRHGRVARLGTPTPSIPYPVGIQFIST